MALGLRSRNVTKTKFTKEKYDAAPKAKLSKIRGPASAAIPGHIPKSPNADNGFSGLRNITISERGGCGDEGHAPDCDLKEAKLFATRNHTSNWKEIAAHLPGRTKQACRKYYRQMKARCDRWPIERQNTLCKVYESQKVEMWTKIGGRASVPWQFAKQMYWRNGAMAHEV
ncbi:hypothetical protein E4U32_005710 [Claviceps aff. humidiphila group G2b]|nr:hypothetical protein E4U32_005710 [Claviceps aff. humidiphila group G2b]